MIATEPLPEEVWAELGWRDGLLVGDMHHLFFYAQRTIDDRIAIGGRGAPYQLSQPIAEHNERSESVRTRLVAALARHFPAAADADITHHWGGPLAVPRDWSMSVGYNRERGYGRAGGYSGHGVAAANIAGRTLADLVLGTRHRSGVTAVGRSPQPPVGARAAALSGFTDDHPRASRRRRARGCHRAQVSADAACRAVHAAKIGVEPSGVLPAGTRRDPPAGRCRRHWRIRARSLRASGHAGSRQLTRRLDPAGGHHPASAKCTSTRFRLRMPPLLHFLRTNPHPTGEDFVRTMASQR